MNRSRAIASSLAVTGVLVSLTVAGVAVVNATDSDKPTESATLVVASEPLAAPTFSAQPLPDVSVPVLATPQAPTVAPEEQTTDDQAAAPQTTPSVSRAEARALVLAQAQGEIVKTWSAVRDGYRAYAVKVLRPDGSLATGFVDRATGVVFDWTTVAAPKASAQSGDDDESYGDDDDDHGSTSDDHESESHDEDDD